MGEINFDSVPERPEQPNQTQYLKCGVHTVTITGLTEVTPEGKSPYISATFINDNGEHTEKMYTSKAAQDYTTEKLQKICIACGMDKAKISSIKSIEQLDKELAGKKLDIKLSGRETETTNGMRMYPQFGLGKFCAPAGSHSLVFKDNKRGEKGDIQWIPEKTEKKEDGNKLPF